MRRGTVAVVIVVIIAALIAFIVYRMSSDRKDDCIQSPKLHSEEQTAKANDLANKLKTTLTSSGNEIDADSQFKAGFSDALKYDYDKLSDENVTFFLFSQAIYCYLKLHTQAGDKAADQYTQMLYDRHRQAHGVQGAGEPLTAGEKAELQSSRYGAEALKLLSELPK